jgi:hypothetical protein
VIVVLNESAERFQTLGVEYTTLFNSLELIWIQHWNAKELVENAAYHLKGNTNSIFYSIEKLF